MLAVATLILFSCAAWFDFRPMYARRKELKGLWLYALMTLAAFVVLMLIGFGVKPDLSRLFYR